MASHLLHHSSSFQPEKWEERRKENWHRKRSRSPNTTDHGEARPKESDLIYVSCYMSMWRVRNWEFSQTPNPRIS